MKTNYFFIVAFVAVAMFFSCQNKSANVEKRVVVTPEGDTLFAFSSMEEAEWMALPFDILEKSILNQIRQSSTPTVCFPLDSLAEAMDISVVKSDDGIVSCLGHPRHPQCEIPTMTILYKAGGKLCAAEVYGTVEDCYFCLSPDTVLSFKTDKSTLYLVWGYSGYNQGSSDCYGLYAYELDDKGFRPAFVLGEEGQFSIMPEYCYEDERYENLADDDPLFYFDKNESAIYLKELVQKKGIEQGCDMRMTGDYWKYVWNGEKFIQTKRSSK